MGDLVRLGAIVYLVGAVVIFVISSLIMGYITRRTTPSRITLIDVCDDFLPSLVIALFWPVVVIASPVFVGVGAAVLTDIVSRTWNKLRRKHLAD